MYIVVDALETSLSQTITPTEDLYLGAIRTYLYKDQNPSGSLKLTLKQSTTEIWSDTKTISSIIAESPEMTTTNYYHGFYSWETEREIKLRKGVDYDIILEGVSGYTDGIGWVKEHEDHTNDFTTSISSNLNNPHSLQLWVWEASGMIRILNISDGFTSASSPSGSELEIVGGYLYWRQTSGTDTDGDWRTSITAGNKLDEKRVSGSWVPKAEVE